MVGTFCVSPRHMFGGSQSATDSVVTKIITGEVRDFDDGKAIQHSREEAHEF